MLFMLIPLAHRQSFHLDDFARVLQSSPRCFCRVAGVLISCVPAGLRLSAESIGHMGGVLGPGPALRPGPASAPDLPLIYRRTSPVLLLPGCCAAPRCCQ